MTARKKSDADDTGEARWLQIRAKLLPLVGELGRNGRLEARQEAGFSPMVVRCETVENGRRKQKIIYVGTAKNVVLIEQVRAFLSGCRAMHAELRRLDEYVRYSRKVAGLLHSMGLGVKSLRTRLCQRHRRQSRPALPGEGNGLVPGTNCADATVAVKRTIANMEFPVIANTKIGGNDMSRESFEVPGGLKLNNQASARPAPARSTRKRLKLEELFALATRARELQAAGKISGDELFRSISSLAGAMLDENRRRRRRGKRRAIPEQGEVDSAAPVQEERSSLG